MGIQNTIMCRWRRAAQTGHYRALTQRFRSRS
jgi:hypothetical protein